MNRYAVVLAGAIALSQVNASAQFGNNNTTFTPRFTSGIRNAATGECKIRVRVDQDVEVAMRGERVTVRVLRGGPGYDEGSECTGPLPTGRISQFDYRQTDGRGRAELVSRPEYGNQPVVIRVSDSGGGSDKYTLEFRWTSEAGGRFGGRREDRLDAARAMNICRDEVRDRISNQYRNADVEFRNVRVDNRPGRSDYITGEAMSRRGNFRFACRVDFESGRVRSVDVDRY